MKTLNTIVKVITALAAVAGAIYIIASYGDKIVAWAKSAIAKCPVVIETDAPVQAAPAEEENADAPEAVSEEEFVQAEAAPVEENVPVADEADFEG